VAAALELWDKVKLAGWKRGSDGSLKLAAVLDEDWRACTGGLRRACDGMARDSTPILGESGGGILLCSERGDMECRARSREYNESSVGVPKSNYDVLVGPFDDFRKPRRLHEH